jgi:hypothetical protein
LLQTDGRIVNLDSFDTVRTVLRYGWRSYVIITEILRADKYLMIDPKAVVTS